MFYIILHSWKSIKYFYDSIIAAAEMILLCKVRSILIPFQDHNLSEQLFVKSFYYTKGSPSFSLLFYITMLFELWMLMTPASTSNVTTTLNIFMLFAKTQIPIAGKKDL